MTRFYISDLHFYHKNVIRLDDRGFEDLDEMHEYMIKQWNKKVHKNDEVVILGDLCWGRAEQANEIIKRLNGKKFLIIGNHDHFVDEKNFDKTLFQSIDYYREFKDNKRTVICSHYPIVCYNKQFHKINGKPKAYMLHGHIHNTKEVDYIDEYRKIVEADVTRNCYTTQTPDGDVVEKQEPVPFNMINCFCKYSDYTPLTLDEWIEFENKRWKNASKKSVDFCNKNT